MSFLLLVNMSPSTLRPPAPSSALPSGPSASQRASPLQHTQMPSIHPHAPRLPTSSPPLAAAPPALPSLKPHHLQEMFLNLPLSQPSHRACHACADSPAVCSVYARLPVGAVCGASLSSSGAAAAPRPKAESFYCIPGSQAAHSEGAQKCLWENNRDPKMNKTIRALRVAQCIQWPPSKSKGSDCLPTSCSSGGFPSLSRENSRSFSTTCRALLSPTTSQSKLLLLTEKNATSHYNRNFSQCPTELSLVVLSLAGDLNP